MSDSFNAPDKDSTLGGGVAPNTPTYFNAFSRVPGQPSFRMSATNAVAVIPLLSSNKDGAISDTESSKSFKDLITAFHRYCHHPASVGEDEEEKELLLIVPNSSLTRPGDWRYDNTPFKFFHWGHGCQRLLVFDGRPEYSRMAHDRIINHGLTRDWIDFCPARRTAAVIGVVNMRDCPDQATLHRAEEELQLWAQRYSTPPYEVTAHGRGNERDTVVERLFVFDSFDESCQQVNLNNTKFGTNILAFPPSDIAHAPMMDLHLNVVVNDLAVAIFSQIEQRIRESDGLKGTGDSSGTQQTKSRFSRMISGDSKAEEPMSGNTNLSLSNIANVLGPDSSSSGSTSKFSQIADHSLPGSSRGSTATKNRRKPAPQLLTPVDEFFDFTELSVKDVEAMKKRDVGRREKFAADLCLLAGSPMDAYERYLKSAEMCKTKCPDPLWYAASMEGCAAAHIAMGEAGGYNVDEYLENNFQLPDEIMALAVSTIQDNVKARPATSKQTLPKIVFTLCEEALNIYSKHPNVACFHAELLMKLALYCTEGEESHMMCRWGEGSGCYGGESNSNRRWKKHSVHKMTFSGHKSKGEDIIVNNTLQRLRRWTELMHRVVSTGALDAMTRADVASGCVRLCMEGLQPTVWKGQINPKIKVPRKAAFFTVVAGEAVSSTGRAEQRGIEVWLLASNLYTKKSNIKDQGGSYGWATLRASVLHALSMHGKSLLSSETADQLLQLLSEIAPEVTGEANDVPVDSDTVAGDDLSIAIDGSQRSDAGILDYSARGDMDPITRFAHLKKAAFFSQMTASSSLLTVHAKWADDDPIPPIQVPLVESSEIAQMVLALKSVWTDIRVNKCSQAQKQIIGNIFALRNALPAVSFKNTTFFTGSVANSGLAPPPLYVSSANVAESESSKSLERIRVGKKKTGAMSTFYNPYANKGNNAILVAEGEERFVSIQFGNVLSVPLEVPSCQIEFNHNEKWRILATSMSFVVPARAKNYSVQFPFTAILAQRTIVNNESSQKATNEEAVDEKDQNTFAIKGLKMTCLGTSFHVDIYEKMDVHTYFESMRSLPDAGWVYPRLPKKKKMQDKDLVKLEFEIVPSQPRLIVSTATTGSFIEDENTLTVYLSDGEIFTSEPFYLENHASVDGYMYGMMERLQIIASGLSGVIGSGSPGTPREESITLYDTDPPEEKEEEFPNRKKEKKPPPGEPELKIVALCDDLSLDGINDPSKRSDKGNKVTFQLIAAHEFENQLAGGRNIRIRFRYRGKSPEDNTEIWRKREVSLRIVRVKGPRISSLTFRPDLSWGCAYSELCVDLSKQNASENIPYESEPAADFDDNSYVVDRVGMDPGVHVCSNDIVILISVANETNSTIVLSNNNGLVGGFEGSPMETITVSSGVSVRIPVVLPRLSRVDAEGNPTQIVDELVAKTELQWKEGLDSFQKEVTGKKRVRKGRMRIPPRCLREIVVEHLSFASRICEPPCSIKLKVGDGDPQEPLEIYQGTPVDTFVEVDIASWIPVEVVEECSLCLEFCCARKDDGVGKISDSKFSRDYVWCGQVRKLMRANDEIRTHRARIVILQPGHFFVSACAKLMNDSETGGEEVWWAPLAEHVIVEKATQPNK